MYFAARQSRCLLFSAVLMFGADLGAQTLQRLNKAEIPPQRVVPQMPVTPTLPKGTSLQVEVIRHYPMKDGEVIEGRLQYPIYVDDKLAVPENTLVVGKVTALAPDKKTRWHARLRGDFTPFHTAEVQFYQLALPDGLVPMTAATATHGAPVLHLESSGASTKRSFLSRQWGQAKSQMHDRVAWFTAPGLGDRALQMLYRQLPYHPERIEEHTAWSFELTAPLVLPQSAVAVVQMANPPASTPSKSESWLIHAILQQVLTSASAKSGDRVDALIVEPVYDKGKQLVIPQGSTLIGKVTSARAARSFGRNGKLRFAFQQVHFPEGIEKSIEGTLGGASTDKTQNLQLDAEGAITPRNQASAIAPLALTVLAGRALDQDGNLTANTAVASNGFGLAGRIVGIVARNRNLAAGLGFYAAGLSFYENFLHTGRDVVFPKDTRIEIMTTPLHMPALKLTAP